MSRPGIIISNKSDGRGMMLPEREGSFTFNKLPFVSMSYPKKEVGLNPSSHKVIIQSKKMNPLQQNEKKNFFKNKLYPLEHYRKIKTSQQFWKKNENPAFKEFNKKIEDKKEWIEEAEKSEIKGKNTFKELIDDDSQLKYSDIEYIKNKKIFSVSKTPKKLEPIKNNININVNTLSDKKNITEETKVIETDITNNKKDNLKPDINDIMPNTENSNDNNEKEKKDNIVNADIKKDNIEEEKDKIKDPLLEDDLDDKENIEDVINFLNGLDYDKYCKDMEIREALTLLKHKMDQEQQEKKNTEEKEKEEITDKQEKPKEEEKNINIINNNKTILPEINNKIPEQNKVEIVDEEELKRKEEIKKYKRAELIAKSDQMKAVHSVNSIKKLLEREGLDKVNEQPPLKITVIKENPIANMDEYQVNKLPFLHSLPLV